MTARVLVCTGEASGDALAAEALARLAPAPDVRGIAGPALRALGVHADVRAEDVSGVGIVEALGAARRAPAVLRRVGALLHEWRPDLVWTVDNPGLNLRIGRLARRRGLRVVHLGSPQVWAWRPGRVGAVAKAADVVLCLLPFEPAWYAGTGVRAVFVGHPAARLAGGGGVPEGSPIVGLAPGSRPSEVAALWPTFREVARRVAARAPGTRFRVAVAPTIDPGTLGGLDATWCRGLAEAARGAQAFIVASGTATLEIAARGLPMVVAYRVHPLTWAIGRRLVRVQHLALPNVLAGRTVVPEHLQALDPDAMAADVLRLLGPEGPAVGAALRDLVAPLEGERAADRIAAEVAAALHRGGSQHVTRPKAASHRP